MNKPGPELLSVAGLCKDYESPAGKLPVLKGVDFHLKAGQMSLIYGRSGSGKSTLLHLMGGLDRPTAGTILFENHDLSTLSQRELARIRNRRLGFVFQFYHLIPELTLFQNVLLPSLIAGRPDKKWARELLKRVRLSSRQDHYPQELSGGEQQRAAVARALMNHPAVILCDEPTGNLDEETAEEVISLLNDLNRYDGLAFVIVTHDEAVAWHYTDVYRLQDGVLFLNHNNQKSAGPLRT